MLYLAATFISCGRRAIVPSGLIISIRAAAGCIPARRVRSIAASVCPARLSTPLSCARNGLTCPGRPKSVGLALGFARWRIVSARSCIDTPVVHPSSLSMVTVNGVPSIDVLSSTCIVSPSCLHRSLVTGVHSTPLPSLIMKFTFSSVIASAAIMKSPSFSRSSSSTTITNSPLRNCSMASSIVFNLNSLFSVMS